MQKKTRNILTKLIIVLLICSAVYYAALHIHIGNTDPQPADTGENTEIENNFPEPEPFVEPPVDENYGSVGFNLGSFLYKDIYINGYHINNWQIYQPFVSVEGTVFVPMSECIEKALGLSVSFDDERHWVKFSKRAEGPSLAHVYEGNCACNLKYEELYWGHSYTFGEEEAPMGSAATTKEAEGVPRTLYLSLDALKDYSGLDFSYYYDQVGGVYISTLRDVPAREFYSENNTKYIEGRARYMMQVNPNLSYETALYYEYLFRHEGAVYTYCDEDTLMGICQTESRYDHTAVSEVEAIGLMQVMLIYAEEDGYTLEMIRDPHYNIQRGASWLEMFIEYCDGDPQLGLAAYYLGPGNLYDQINNYGTYDSNYADVCNYHKSMLQSFAADGYSNTFVEYTGK
ncbi:MAG: lytic transglycosylase domain-containing protein [Firmicutes bacterium]|nr:lytic transglycosylase domain-containing protein [Bacillota bacterium]